jgi:hypothetical protein
VRRSGGATVVDEIVKPDVHSRGTWRSTRIRHVEKSCHLCAGASTRGIECFFVLIERLVELRADELVGLTSVATPGLGDGVPVTEGIP